MSLPLESIQAPPELTRLFNGICVQFNSFCFVLESNSKILKLRRRKRGSTKKNQTYVLPFFCYFLQFFLVFIFFTTFYHKKFCYKLTRSSQKLLFSTRKQSQKFSNKTGETRTKFGFRSNSSLVAPSALAQISAWTKSISRSTVFG